MSAIDFWLKTSRVAKAYEQSPELFAAERRFRVSRRELMKFGATLVAAMGCVRVTNGRWARRVRSACSSGKRKGKARTCCAIDVP